ncbi:DUF397 domain-containing protein [Sphaerisporangium sp. NPDC005289]|uniref:DUF397 domain-containing protein n=1 Tax=Sphaerisporangium sp. NPDC005289 TaxID=3155247 RepID=UPI0033A446F6
MTNLADAQWRKSSRSGSGNNCVEVAVNQPGIVAIRDSKELLQPAVSITSAGWHTFVHSVKLGDLTDRLR